MADDRRKVPGSGPVAGAEPVPAPTPFDEDDESWEADLAAWDAAIPVVVRGSGSRSGPAVTPSGSSPAPAGATPIEENPFAETPTTVVGEAMDLDDLPELIPSGVFDSGPEPASGSYAALIATDESTPGLFDAEPGPEAVLEFPAPTLPELGAARWTGDLSGLITLGAGAPAAPAPAYLEGLAAVLADERTHEQGQRGGPGRPKERGKDDRAIALALGAARVAEQRGRTDEARAHLDAALAEDGASTAAHRARWILGERLGQLDDEGAAESLSRLALMPHPDQAYYRSLKAEWALARRSRGISDATAPALVTAAPEGVGRLLAEAELAWRQPASAAALLESAAERVGGALGAALLACAAHSSEAGRNLPAAAAQRQAAAKLGDRDAPEAMGMIRDVARLEPVAAVGALEDLLGRLPLSALTVALARWGAAAARRIGEPARAWRFVADVGRIAPATLAPGTGALLVRARLDLWAARPSSGSGALSFGAVTAPVATAWPSPAARTCLALYAGAALGLGEEDPETFLRTVEALVREQPDTPALAPALEQVAVAAGPAIRARALRLVRLVDPARWVPASLELADVLAALPEGQIEPEDSAEAVLLETAARHPAGLAFWRASTVQTARGDHAAAAATLARGLSHPTWRATALAAPLEELAAEQSARTGPPGIAEATTRLEAAPLGRTMTLERLLRRGRDRERWSAYVATQLALPPQNAERARRAGLFVEPLFWTGDGASGDDVPLLAAAALDLVPLHPTGLGLMLAARPRPAALGDRLRAGAEEPSGGARALLTAAVATAIAGDGPRALASARDALRAAGAAATKDATKRGAAALVRRLLWAAPDALARAQILREVLELGGTSDAAALVEAAESAEADGPRAEIALLYARARDSAGAEIVGADIAAGLDRTAGQLSSVSSADAAAVDASRVDTRFTEARGDGDDGLAALELAARASQWPDVVRTLVERPPHESSAGPTTLALAAELDEGRAGGARAGDLWTLTAAGFAAARTASGGEGAAPGELKALFRAAERSDAAPARAGNALERIAALAAATPLADPRSAALFLVEAAARAPEEEDPWPLFGDDPGTPSTAERRLRAALGRDPASVPVALAWRRWLARAGRIDEAAAAAAAEAETLVEPELRVQALLRAAALLGASTGSGRAAWAVAPVPIDADGAEVASSADGRVDRAAAYLNRALQIAPHDHDAFSRLRTLYEEHGRSGPLADLLGARLHTTSNPFEATALRLARTELFAGPLGDPGRARGELEAILHKEPQHARALARLADLEQDQGNHVGAAELLIRQAFTERSPPKLRELFLRLGRIYTQHAPDPKRAIGAYSRVLQLDAGNLEALEELSRLYLRLGENKNAVSMTERLIQLELIPARRALYHVRLGHLAERGGDVRTAGQHFRRAVDEAPRDLEALGELVRHLEKARDTVGRRTLLDRAAADLRKGVLAAPGDATLLAALMAVSRWRGRAATAAAAAELRALTDTADGKLPDWAAPPPSGRRVAALANPTVDEQTFTAAVPPSVRHLFRLLGPVLWEGGRSDLGRLGVEKSDRIAPGRPPRDLVDPIAAELAAGPFELYMPTSQEPSGRQPLLVEPGKPPLLVFAAALVDLGPHAVRFMSARALRLVATHLDIAVAGDAVELGAWLTGVIRQYVPEYRHPNVPVEVAAARTARVSKLMPRKLRQEVMPFALESSGALDLAALHAGIRDGANRVGLLASGSLGAALRVVLGAAGSGLDGRISTAAIKRDAQSMALVSFALSDEYDDLVRALE